MASNKNKLIFFWKDIESMILNCFMYRVGKYKHIVGAGSCVDIVVWGKGRYIEVYMLKKSYDRTIRDGKKLLNKKFADKHFADCEEYKKRFNKFVAEKRKTDYVKFSNKELLRELDELWALETEGMAYYATSQEEPLIAAKIKMEKILSRYFRDKSAIQEKRNLLMVSNEFDKAQLQEMDWAWLVKNNKIFTRADFLSHGLKYSFMFRNIQDLDKAFVYFRYKFKKDKKNIRTILAGIEKLKKEKVETVKRQSQLLNRTKDNQLVYLSWLFQRFAIERMNLKYTWAGIEDFLFHDLFREVARRMKIDYFKMVSYYRIEDILSFLSRGKKLSKNEILARGRVFILGARNNQPFFYSGGRAIAEAKKKYPELVDNNINKEIKGTVASQGIVKGEVFVVFSEGLDSLGEVDKKFKAGQILVTGMTQPNMVPLMNKAGAIVTDEGGLTSHAAVISRELKIPCIVGTHRASNVLKTGDMVLVDAEKGIVRILK